MRCGKGGCAAPFLGNPLVEAAVEAIVVDIVLILHVNIIVTGLDDLGRFCGKVTFSFTLVLCCLINIINII